MADNTDKVGRDRKGRFTAQLPVIAGEPVWTDSAEVTHTNPECANQAPGMVAGQADGWLCCACVKVEVLPARARQMMVAPELAGAGGRKGSQVEALLATGRAAKDIAAIVGCAVSRVYEVRRAVARRAAQAA